MLRSFVLFLATFVCIDSNSLAQSVEELVTEGNNAYSASDYEKEVSFFEQAIKIDKFLPSNVYLIWGQSYEALHQYEKAVLTYTSMQDRSTPQIYLRLITVLAEKQNKIGLARDTWNRLQKSFFNSLASYFGLCKILNLEGEHQKAIDTIKYGITLYPANIFLLKNYFSIVIKLMRMIALLNCMME